MTLAARPDTVCAAVHNVGAIHTRLTTSELFQVGRGVTLKQCAKPGRAEATITVKPVRQNTSAEKVRKKYVAHAHRKSMKAPSHHQDQMYYGYAALKAAQRRDR
jgi:hypothetical protein